jgi:16S rRNA (uracil1498-N3)-methyltransferase
MARRRFFVDSLKNGIAELHGDEARHLTRVLRVEPGERFEISDNHAAYLAEISEARGERVVFQIIEAIPAHEPALRITLLAALFKFDHFEWMIEKATELGAGRIVPVEAVRTEKGLFEASHKRAERWRRIAREASQQSRRTRLPEITRSVKFNHALAEAASFRCFLDEDEAKPLLAALPQARAAGDTAALLLGPEGGWTDAEREAARTAGWIPVSLGPQILRAETAAAAALAILTNAWMV